MDGNEKDLRLPALRRFAVAITILNIVGQTFLGFEQAWAHLVISILTAYGVETAIEVIDAASSRRRVRFSGGLRPLADFLLSPHITACAVAMLLYAGGRFVPVAFAAAVAIASKTLVRAPSPRGSRHVLNPSNFGITATLLLFPEIGIAPPYQFTENLSGVGVVVLPLIIVCTGTFLNAKFTRRLPLIAAWLVAFAAQAVVRSLFSSESTISALLPMTGVTFVLFTFYMVTDPATTPTATVPQIGFGAAVALAYGTLVFLHVVFGLFFALTLVTTLRGAVLYAGALVTKRVSVPGPIPLAPERSGV